MTLTTDALFEHAAERWPGTALAPWLDRLPAQLEQGFSVTRYGDLPKWQKALAGLPSLPVDQVYLDRDRVGCNGDIDEEDRLRLIAGLRALHPWRKGPFELFGIHIDTEWRSDWKWQRLLPGLQDLQGKRVLDVGCGSGYHCWRMLGAGAREVIGIDPTPLFNLQFAAIQHYLQQPDICVLPVAMEQIPRQLQAFETVFSMGVLYHRRSPMDHLLELRDALCSGGQLVLETLVVDGDEDTVFVPPGRYARMGNVWYLPSTRALCRWLEKIGFIDPSVIDENHTTTDEQRATDWMRFHSLGNFLDPENKGKTLEGHPAPQRAIVVARAP